MPPTRSATADLATTCAVALTVLAGSSAAALAQSPATKPHPAAAATYFPLAPGAAWTWRKTCSAGAKSVTTDEVAWNFGEVPLDGGDAHQWLLTDGIGPRVEPVYWSTDSNGIYIHDRHYLGDLRGAHGRIRLVPAPLGIEGRWQWESRLAYQTMGEVHPDAEADRIVHRGELVALAEPVQVPAGRFTAAHVRITETCSQWDGAHVRDFWFAPATGIVKSCERANDETTTRELVAYVPGRPVADAATVMRRHLAASATADAAGPPQVDWVPMAEAACYLQGRAAVVTFAGGRREACWIAAGSITTFAADDLPFWRARLQELRADPPACAPNPARTGQAAAPPDGMHLCTLAKLAAAVEARRTGGTDLREAGSSSETGGREPTTTTGSARLHGRSPAGESMVYETVLQASGPQLASIATRIAPQ